MSLEHKRYHPLLRWGLMAALGACAMAASLVPAPMAGAEPGSGADELPAQPLEQIAVPWDLPLPVIPGAQVVWLQTSSDGKEMMAVLSWKGTVAAAADFYEKALKEAGYEEVERVTVQAPNVVAVQLSAYGAWEASVAIQQTAGQPALQIVLTVSE